jgi:hypothetical protein
MNNYQLSPKETIGTQDIDPLAILFFFLGALDIYSSVNRKLRQRQEKYEERLKSKKGITLASYGKVALLALLITGIMEVSLF